MARSKLKRWHIVLIALILFITGFLAIPRLAPILYQSLHLRDRPKFQEYVLTVKTAASWVGRYQVCVDGCNWIFKGYINRTVYGYVQIPDTWDRTLSGVGEAEIFRLRDLGKDGAAVEFNMTSTGQLRVTLVGCCSSNGGGEVLFDVATAEVNKPLLAWHADWNLA